MLNNMELKDIQEIESKYYMRPILEKINSFLFRSQIQVFSLGSYVFTC